MQNTKKDDPTGPSQYRQTSLTKPDQELGRLENPSGSTSESLESTHVFGREIMFRVANIAAELGNFYEGPLFF